MPVEPMIDTAEPAPRLAGIAGGESLSERVHAIADQAKSLPKALAKLVMDCRDAALIAPPDKVAKLASKIRRRALKVECDVSKAFAGGPEGEAIAASMAKSGFTATDGMILADTLRALAAAIDAERSGVH